jgi:hypothetical protein
MSREEMKDFSLYIHLWNGNPGRSKFLDFLWHRRHGIAEVIGGLIRLLTQSGLRLTCHSRSATADHVGNLSVCRTVPSMMRIPFPG